MTISQTPSAADTKRWKLLLLALCLCCAGMRLWAMVYLERSVVPAAAGGIGAKLSPAEGPLWLRKVISIEADSDLARQGVKPGDRLSYDGRGDAWRRKGVGEAIPVTIESEGQLRRLSVQTVPQPERVSAVEVGRQLGGLVESWMALALAAVLSWRCAGAKATRALALALALYSVADVGFYLPAGMTQALVFLSGNTLQQALTAAAYLYFAIAYPDAQTRFARPWVRRGYAGLVGISLAFALFLMAFFLRLTPFDPAQWKTPFERVHASLAALLTLASLGFLWSSWRRASGAAKYRAAWIGACLAVMLLSSLLFSLVGSLPGRTLQRELILSCVNIVMALASMLGLAYAVLRHRVFGFGFALNRALVWGLVLAVLLAGVALLRMLGARWPVLADPQVAAGVTVPLALLFAGAVPRLRVWADAVVQRLFFSNWRHNEEALWMAARAAATLQGQDRLLQHYLAAISGFAAGPKAAVYRVGAEACLRMGSRLTATAQAWPMTLNLSGADLRSILAHRLPAALAALAGADGLPLQYRS